MRFGSFYYFLSWYHLPAVCNSLELEYVILHGVCDIHLPFCTVFGTFKALQPLILHGICYILASTSHFLHNSGYMLVLQTFMWVSLGLHFRFL